jgi:sRNA-binding carbon storage regulator CsrA
MLVLSRRIGDSIVIDDLIRATVITIGDEFVDLGLAQLDCTELGHISLDIYGMRPVVHGVNGIMIERMADNRVRLGLEYSEGVTIARSEYADTPPVVRRRSAHD